jgi:biopolymer transport protein ExbD
MKTYLAILALILGVATANAEVVFQGYMTTAGQFLFVVSVDKDKTSGWLTRGQKFEGVSIIMFDPKTELLTVEKDGKQQKIPLAGGKVQATSGGPSRIATKPIVVFLGNDESVSVGDDAAMLDALKKKFEAIAKMEPQPKVTLEPPRDGSVDQLLLIMDTLRKSGITRFDIRSR